MKLESTSPEPTPQPPVSTPPQGAAPRPPVSATPPGAAPPTRTPQTRLRPRALGLAAAGIAVLALAAGGSGFRRAAWPPSPRVAAAPPAGDAAAARQRARLRRFVPREPFIVVDATHNRLVLRDGDAVLLDAVCSSGSGMILQDVGGERRWVFDTPRGRFRILNKTRNPVWKKPDWAFVEEGKPIPEDPGERFEAGVLGEYGMYFGDGFLIHGTLYERLLGRSVTHGCIRLGRQDLRQVYGNVSIGTSIYIY